MVNQCLMVEKSEHRLTSKLRRLTGWAGFGLVVLGIVSGLSTFAILTGLTPIIPTKASHHDASAAEYRLGGCHGGHDWLARCCFF